MGYDPVKTFENFSNDYLRKREEAFDHSEQLKFLGKKLAPLKNKVVLELGCGGGKPVLQYFYDKGATVWGVDLSKEMVSAAKKNLPNGYFLCGDMSKIEVPANTFDAILAFYSVFFLDMESQLHLFRKIYQALKPGGLTYFTVHCEKTTGQEEFSGFLEFFGHQIFYAHTTPEKYVEMLTKTGFKEISQEEITIGEETCLWFYCKKP